MIELRRNIERGMRHRWLGPLFIIVFCVLMALMFLHAMHDRHNMGTELGELCLGITMMLGIVLLIRVRFKATLALVPVRIGRAPPARRLPMGRTHRTALSFPPPLRV